MTATQHASLARFWATECLPAFAKADDLHRIAEQMMAEHNEEIDGAGADRNGIGMTAHRMNAEATIACARAVEADAHAIWVREVRSMLGDDVAISRYRANAFDRYAWIVDGIHFLP